MQLTAKGIVFFIKVHPGSSKEEIVGWETAETQLKIKVTAIAEKGKANAAIIHLLSKHFKIPKKSIEILSGHKSSIKKILLKNLTDKEIEDLPSC